MMIKNMIMMFTMRMLIFNEYEGYNYIDGECDMMILKGIRMS